jgi:hypothetical protein
MSLVRQHLSQFFLANPPQHGGKYPRQHLQVIITLLKSMLTQGMGAGISGRHRRVSESAVSMPEANSFSPE